MEEHEVIYRAASGGRVSFRLTRPDELALVDWDKAQKAAFLHMQFAAQHQFYQERYTKTDFLIMLCDAVPVGRLSGARWEDETRLVDIALLKVGQQTLPLT